MLKKFIFFVCFLPCVGKTAEELEMLFGETVIKKAQTWLKENLPTGTYSNPLCKEVEHSPQTLTLKKSAAEHEVRPEDVHSRGVDSSQMPPENIPAALLMEGLSSKESMPGHKEFIVNINADCSPSFVSAQPTTDAQIFVSAPLRGFFETVAQKVCTPDFCKRVDARVMVEAAKSLLSSSALAQGIIKNYLSADDFTLGLYQYEMVSLIFWEQLGPLVRGLGEKDFAPKTRADVSKSVYSGLKKGLNIHMRKGNAIKVLRAADRTVCNEAVIEEAQKACALDASELVSLMETEFKKKEVLTNTQHVPQTETSVPKWKTYLCIPWMLCVMIDEAFCMGACCGDCYNDCCGPIL